MIGPDPARWRSWRTPEEMAALVDGGIWMNETTWTVATRRAAADPDEVAIRLDDGGVVRVGEAVDEAKSLAAALLRMGMRPGDVVSANLPNWREMAILNLACCALGLVINPIIPIYRDHEVSFILRDAASRILFTSGETTGFDYPAMARRLAAGLPHLEHVVLVRGPATAGATTYAGLVAGDARDFAAAAVDPSWIKLLMYTSGTTGSPKGVLHNHNSLRRSASNSAEARGIGAGDTLLMASPVTHITGYSAIDQAFGSPIRTALMGRWDPKRAVDFIEETGATLTVGATPFLKELVDEAEARRMRLPTLRQFACGGAEVPPQLIYRAHELLENCRCFRVFGSTEVPLVTQGFQAVEDARLAAETDGRIYNYDVRIVDAEGADVAPGEEGEILARGPSMFLGYTDWQQTRDAIDSEGYFRTGDLGRIGEKGSLRISGRKKDIIIRGGENLSAKEIEDVLHRHPAVQEVAVVSMPHPRLGEAVCAYVIPRDTSARSVLPGELQDFVRSSGLAPQKTPEHVEFVSELPRTASGKIRKDILRENIRKSQAIR